MRGETSLSVPCPHPGSGQGAYFDVDETLLVGKSMFGFLAHYLRERGEPSSTYERLTGELRGAAEAGADRFDVNRAYYRIYRGESRDRIARSGMRWFEANRHLPGFFLPSPWRAYRHHRGQGARTVLVSGSFFACLDPLAAHLETDDVLATRPLVHHGELTGEVERPMIGPAKGDAVRDHLTTHGLCPRCSHGYGDHLSDLPFLEAVGHARVVQGDPRLTAVASERGWPVLGSHMNVAPEGGHGFPFPVDCRCGCALAEWSMEGAHV